MQMTVIWEVKAYCTQVVYIDKHIYMRMIIWWILSNITETITPTLADTIQWRHKDHDGVSNHQSHDCLLNRLFRCTSKKTSKLCVTGFCVASYAENVSIWWHHNDLMWGFNLLLQFFLVRPFRITFVPTHRTLNCSGSHWGDWLANTTIVLQQMAC